MNTGAFHRTNNPTSLNQNSLSALGLFSSDEALRPAAGEGSRSDNTTGEGHVRRKSTRLGCEAVPILLLLAGNPASLASLRRPVRAAAMAESNGMITDLDSAQHPPRLTRS